MNTHEGERSEEAAPFARRILRHQHGCSGLPGARALALAGQLTGGCRRNRAWLGERVDVAASVPADLVEIGYDPQTSGGLLVACAAERATEVLQSINAAGYKSARVIGEAVPGAPKIEVVA